MRKISLALIGLAVLFAGCAQETGKNKTVDYTTQDNTPSISAPQRDYQRGPQLTWNIYNAPAKGNISPGSSDGGRTPSTQPTAESKDQDGFGGVNEALASYQQTGFRFVVTIGNTEGTATAAHNVSAVGGAQSSTVNPSTDGTQKPTVQLTTPITVSAAPGSNATGGSTAPVMAAEGGTATGAPTSSTGTPTANYTPVNVPTNVLPSVLDFLKQRFGLVPTGASTQPSN